MVALLAVVAVPGIACFGYYRLEDHGAASGVMSVLIVLAYPLALIGMGCLAVTGFAAQRNRTKIWVSAACATAPIVFLLLAKD